MCVRVRVDVLELVELRIVLFCCSFFFSVLFAVLQGAASACRDCVQLCGSGRRRGEQPPRDGARCTVAEAKHGAGFVAFRNLRVRDPPALGTAAPVLFFFFFFFFSAKKFVLARECNASLSIYEWREKNNINKWMDAPLHSCSVASLFCFFFFQIAGDAISCLNPREPRRTGVFVQNPLLMMALGIESGWSHPLAEAVHILIIDLFNFFGG